MEVLYLNFLSIIWGGVLRTVLGRRKCLPKWQQQGTYHAQFYRCPIASFLEFLNFRISEFPKAMDSFFNYLLLPYCKRRSLFCLLFLCKVLDVTSKKHEQHRGEMSKILNHIRARLENKKPWKTIVKKLKIGPFLPPERSRLFKEFSKKKTSNILVYENVVARKSMSALYHSISTPV